MDPVRHNPLEPEFRLEETDRRTKIGRLLMGLMLALADAIAWWASKG